MNSQFEKITQFIDYKIQEKGNIESYKGIIKKFPKGILLSFAFPASLYFLDLGYKNYEMTFFIRREFFDKYFNEDNSFLEKSYNQSVMDYFFTENDIPLCFAMHTNLICMIYANATGFQKKIFIESYLMFLLYQTTLLKQNDEHICSCKNCNHPMMKKKILAIKKWIDQNLNASINLHDLSNSFGVQNDTLNIHFEKIIGENIYDYIWRKKINLAQNLLSNSVKSFKTIALETGYSCEEKFKIAYRNYFGVAPQLVWVN